MQTFWKAFLVAVFVSATLWSQTGSKPKSDGPGAAQSASPSAGESGDKTPPSAATQSQTPPAPSAAATPGPTPAPGDSTKLEIVKSVRATYPSAAQEKQIQGQVLLKLSVSEKGDVQAAEVVRGDPILAEAALKAAKKWKFKPFLKNGKAIAVTTEIPFDFAFSDGVEDAKKTKDDNAAPDANALKRVRLAGGVVEGNIVHKVMPVYPREAKEKRIEGTVLLHALIDKEGRVVDLKPISGPKELIPASIGAVEQWRYRPYILMGEPVEVETTVRVNFQLRRF
jgi:TonB family protein